MSDQEMTRAVNIRIHQLVRTLADDEYEYLCECGGFGCHELLRLSPDAFARVLAEEGAYLVAPGHDGPGTELLEQRPGYLLVHLKEAGRETGLRSPL